MSMKVHTQYQWVEKFPEKRAKGNSHYRQVFISQENSVSPRWVAKLETLDLRAVKSYVTLPLSEEVAYKICKLFDWDTMPKSKVFHEDSIGNQKPKYLDLMRSFASDTKRMFPFTFTFQIFVEGKTVPNYGRIKTQTPELQSYQKSYLLNIILGREDARGDNSIYNPDTHKLFDIDNECIGCEYYDPYGILRDFSDLREKEISSDILDRILNVSSSQFFEIRDKYKVREKTLLDFWSREIFYIPEYNPEGKIERSWSVIINNFKFLQEGILTIKKHGDLVTVDKIEQFISDSYKELNKPKSYNYSMWRT